MMSTKAQTRRQSQHSTIFHERILNKHSIHSSRQLTDSNTNQITLTHDTPIDEQTSLCQQNYNQHRLSIKSLTTSFDRFPSWNNIYTRKTSSASTFCGETINTLPVCLDRRQSAFHSTSYSGRNNHQQQQQQHRLFSLTQAHFNSSSIRLPIDLTMTSSNNDNTITNDQSPVTNHLSITRLVPTTLAGSYDHLLTNQINVPLSTSFDITSQHSSPSNEHSPDVTMTKTASANFYYIPASDSLVYTNLVGTSQNTIASLASTIHTNKNTLI